MNKMQLADKIQFAKRYLKYRLTAKHRNGYGIHSPFLYEFVRNVLYSNRYFYAYDTLAELRYDLLDSDEVIKFTDFGAGSKVLQSKTRKIRDIVKVSAISEKFGELLFRLVEAFKPETILELGTSLGLGTMYLALPNPNARVFTIEACPETAKKAGEHFKDAEIDNIIQITGNIDDELPILTEKLDKLDFVYIDANHTKDAVLNYFYRCMKKSHNDTVFFIDDIHWSKGMEEAWNKIKADEKVRLTIDLFFGGLVFLNKDLSKENFVLKF